MTGEEFRDYVAANYDRFLRFVRSLVRPPADPEDVLQGALLALWVHREPIDPAAPGGFFFRSLRNACISSFRGRGAQPRAALGEEDPPDRRAHDPAGGSGGTRGGDRLAAALQKLSGRRPPVAFDAAIAEVEAALGEALRRLGAGMTAQQRRVFAASLRARGSRSEAVASLDLPSPTSYTNALHRARERLRAVLSPHREALLRVLGAARVWELLFAAFCPCPEAPLSEGER